MKWARIRRWSRDVRMGRWQLRFGICFCRNKPARRRPSRCVSGVCRRENPDLIILDLALPDRDGLDLLTDLLAVCHELGVTEVVAATPEAYAAIWIILFAMVLLSWRRQRQIDARVASLDAALTIARAVQASQDEKNVKNAGGT